MNTEFSNQIVQDGVEVLAPNSWITKIEKNELIELTVSGISENQIRLIKPSATLGADSSMKILPDVSGVYRKFFGCTSVTSYIEVMKRVEGVDIAPISLSGQDGFMYRFTTGELNPITVLVPSRREQILQVNIEGVYYPTLDSVRNDEEIQRILSSITFSE